MKIQNLDFNINLLEALLWQYNNAETLQSLLQQKQDWYDSSYTSFWTDWYNNVFNLETANEFGLTVWSIILDINFAIAPNIRTDNNIIGFENTHRKNFFRSNFKPAVNSDSLLTIEQKRMVLRLRYLQLTSRGTVPEINRALTMLFGYKVYIIDGYDMTNNYIVFTQPIPRDLEYILDNYDLIPRPAGVGVKRVVYSGDEIGFGEFHNNFYESFFGTN